MRVQVRTIGLPINGHRNVLLQPMALVPDGPVTLEVQDGATAEQVVSMLGLRVDQPELVIVNGRDCGPSTVVRDGDALLLTGAFTGD